MEQENIRFEKSDLPPYIIKVKVGKDGAPLTPQETLTVKIDYSDCVCTEDSWLYDVPDNYGRRDAERNLRMEVILDDEVFGSKHYNATKLASSVLPVSSISPFRVEMCNMCNKRLPFRTPVIFKRNTYNIGQLGIPSPEAFLSFYRSDDSIAGSKKNHLK